MSNDIRQIIDEAKLKNNSDKLDEALISLDNYHKRLGIQEKNGEQLKIALIGGLTQNGEIKKGFLQDIRDDFCSLKLEVLAVAKICRDCTTEKINQKKNKVDWWKWGERAVLGGIIGYLIEKLPK